MLVQEPFKHNIPLVGQGDQDRTTGCGMEHMPITSYG